MPDKPFEIAPDAIAFDNAVETYERTRPSYPESLFDDLWARLTTRKPLIVEVGPGTGKATASLLARGAIVVGVEPGPNMAAFVGAKFAREFRGKFHVLNSPFETADLAPGSFDALFAATSFHWVDPKIRLVKAHEVVNPDGAIAIVQTNQISSDTDRGFFDAAQPIYRRYFPGESRPEVPTEEVVPEEYSEIAASPLFGDAELLRYRWDQTYSAEGWADLMRSFSGTQMMAEDAREGLVRDLSAFIDAEFGGEIVRPLVITLTFARRAN